VVFLDERVHHFILLGKLLYLSLKEAHYFLQQLD
jgi:hypothetical protein